jgi:hypothetical protein
VKFTTKELDKSDDFTIRLSETGNALKRSTKHVPIEIHPYTCLPKQEPCAFTTHFLENDKLITPIVNPLQSINLLKSWIIGQDWKKMYANQTIGYR